MLELEIGQTPELSAELENVQITTTSDFDELENRPKYAGQEMTHETEIPEVPTKTSELQNDSGFLTEHQSLSAYRTSAEQDIIDTSLSSDIATLQTENEQLKDDVKFLKAVTEGKNYIVETDSAEAYAKSIKSNVIPEANKASVDSFGGKSVVRNQLFENSNFSSLQGLERKNANLSVSDNILEVAKESTMTIGAFAKLKNVSASTTHKYLIRGYFKVFNSSVSLYFGFHTADTVSGNTVLETTSTDFVHLEGIVSPKTDADILSIRSGNASTAVEDSIAYARNVSIVDLTVWFGSGNEPSSVDDPRIAMIAAFLDANPSYYNTGEIVSAETQQVVSRGKNLFDKANAQYINAYVSGTTFIGSSNHKTIYLSCQPNTTYTCINSANNRNYLCSLSNIPVANGSCSPIGTTITTRAEDKFIAVYCYNRNTDTVTFEDVLNAIQIEESSTATPYSPYKSPIYLPVPTAVKALEGYGESNGADVNTVDFVNKIYHKKGYYDSSDAWVSDVQDIDISDLLTDFSNAIEVESGGTVTYEQQAGGLELPVPNTISYLRKVVSE